MSQTEEVEDDLERVTTRAAEGSAVGEAVPAAVAVRTAAAGTAVPDTAGESAVKVVTHMSQTEEGEDDLEKS